MEKISFRERKVAFIFLLGGGLFQLSWVFAEIFQAARVKLKWGGERCGGDGGGGDAKK